MRPMLHGCINGYHFSCMTLHYLDMGWPIARAGVSSVWYLYLAGGFLGSLWYARLRSAISHRIQLEAYRAADPASCGLLVCYSTSDPASRSRDMAVGPGLSGANLLPKSGMRRGVTLSSGTRESAESDLRPVWALSMATRSGA